MKIDTKKIAPLALLGLVIILALSFQISHLMEPLTGDASLFITLQKEMAGRGDFPEIDLHRGLGLWHTMLYQYCLAAIGYLFGPDLLYDRIFGMILFVVDCFLILLITAKIINKSPNSFLPVLAVSLFALSPFGIIGGIHIDIDNSVIPTILLFYTWYFIDSEGAPPLKRLLILSGIFAVSLLCKLTTPLALIGAAFFTYLFHKRYRESLYYSLGVMILGGLLFLSAWFFITHFLDYPFVTVFTKFFSAATGKTGTIHNPLELIRLILTLLYCLTPPMVFYWLFVISKTATDKDKEVKPGLTFIVLLSLIITITYLLIGGMAYGIPKYHYSTIPLMAIVVTWGIQQYATKPSTKGIFILIVIGLIATGLLTLVGDPILHLNYDYKEYLLFKQIPPGINDGFFSVIFRDMLIIIGPTFFLFFLLFFKSTIRTRAVWLIIVLFFSLSLSQYIERFAQPYNVIFAYGSRGGDEVLKNVRTGSRVLISEGFIIPAVSEKAIQFIHPHLTRGFDSVDDLVETVDKYDPDYIVTGITIDSLSTLRDIYGNRVFLNTIAPRYTFNRIGSYFVWSKDGQHHDPQ